MSIKSAMANRFVHVSALVLVVLAPSAAFAVSPGGEGEHHSMFTISFLYSVINFLLLIGLLTYFLRKPLRDFLLGRREDVRRSIDEANAAKQKAEAALAEYRDKMAHLDTELSALRQEILAAGDAERDTIVGGARAQADKIVADTRLVGEQEVRRAKGELREEMVRLAVALAETSLVTSISPQDREKQLDEFISKLEALS